MEIFSSYKLPVSEENAWLVPLIAMELGWYEGMSKTPEEVIQNHFENFYSSVRGVVELSTQKYFGKAGSANVASIMALYDENLEIR